MRFRVSDTAELNSDDAHESEIASLLIKYLWQAFETSAPDTPQRITRVVLHALRTNGFTITKQGGNE